MDGGPPAQLSRLLAQLERGERTSSDAEKARVCGELAGLGRQWPKPAPEGEQDLAERLIRQLFKFPEARQQDVVNAFGPLQDSVRRGVAEATSSLNRWLSDAADPDKNSIQRVVTLLQGIEASFWFGFYKQCPDVRAKAAFLCAAAACARALHGDDAPLRAKLLAHDPKSEALVRQFSHKLFVIPRHGNVLDTWHDGRLQRYNRTLWRAGRRAAERWGDELQVRLVSAMRRAAASAPGAAPKAKLELQLRAWPMAGCPLARSFLDFVAQRGAELGDLGTPALAECPPHSLRPHTLRRLLGKLAAFEVLDSQEEVEGEKVSIVRLRRDGVEALAFKAVGTKPKASAVPGAQAPSPAASPRLGPAPARAAKAKAAAAAKPVAGAVAVAGADASAAPSASGPKAAPAKAVPTASPAAGPKAASAKAAAAPGRAPAKAAAAAGPAAAGSAAAAPAAAAGPKAGAPPPGAKARPGTKDKAAPAGQAAAPAGGRDGDAAASAARRARGGAAGGVAGRKRTRSRSEASSYSKRSRRRRRGDGHRQKRKPGGAAGSAARAKPGAEFQLSPGMVMMSPMMGMSMMMANPMAMMGMGPQMLHPLPGLAQKASRADRSKKNKESGRTASKPQAKKLEDEAAGAKAAAAAAGAASPAPKQAKLDKSKRKDSMIDNDDL